MRIRLLALGALAAVALPACGDSGNGDDGAARTARTVPQSPVPRRALDLPQGVPLRSSGAPADPAQAKVIRDWTDALRGGDVRAASALWTIPSKVQNGTPVIELSSRAAVRLFQASLPCGARVTESAGAPRGFTIVTLRLTQRRGGDCGSGAGSSARTAIRVRDGKIVEWYRLPEGPGGDRRGPGPDDPGGDRPGPGPAPDGGDGDETTV